MNRQSEFERRAQERRTKLHAEQMEHIAHKIKTTKHISPKTLKSMKLVELLGLARTISREYQEADSALVDKEVLRRARKHNYDGSDPKHAIVFLEDWMKTLPKK